MHFNFSPLSSSEFSSVAQKPDRFIPKPPFPLASQPLSFVDYFSSASSQDFIHSTCLEGFFLIDFHKNWFILSKDIWNTHTHTHICWWKYCLAEGHCLKKELLYRITSLGGGCVGRCQVSCLYPASSHSRIPVLGDQQRHHVALHTSWKSLPEEGKL